MYYPINCWKYKKLICAVCRDKNGKYITAYGYKWEYDEIIVDNEEWQYIKSEIIDGVKVYKISNCGRLKNHKGQNFCWF